RRAPSRRDHDRGRGIRQPHAERARGEGLDALVRGPRALLERELRPFLAELLGRGLLVLELVEALARLVLRGDDAERAGDDEDEEHEDETDQRVSVLSATRKVALRARGLRRTSGSDARIPRPTVRS